MDIQVISFCLALVVGVVCFGLVKYTADEFDRWYEEPHPRRTLRIPVAVISVIAIFAATALIAVAL